MKRIKRMIAVFLYLFIVALVLKLEIKELLNLPQLLLVMGGGMILYLPSMESKAWKQKKFDYKLIARNVLYSSYIEALVLLFFLLYSGQGNGAGSIASNEVGLLMKNLALSLRPLLYGIFLWIALGGEADTDKKVDEERTERVWTAQECYERFLEMGLTRREAEVAVQIGKGLSNKEIAIELNIAETTVKKHIANIFEKLGVEKREEITERLTE